MHSKKHLLLLSFSVLLLLIGWVTFDVAPPTTLVQAARRAYRRNKANVASRRYLTVIDYSKPLICKRLWVIDVATGKTVFTSHVSHALKSGLMYATQFSNVEGSEKSCIGSFVTQDTYSGKFGYSLRVRGLDAQNSNTLLRHVVFHPHPVPLFSEGCWMTMPATNRQLIGLIKGGTFVYVSASPL